MRLHLTSLYSSETRAWMMLRMEMYFPSSCSRARWCADTMIFLGCSRRRITSSTVVFTVAACAPPSGGPLAVPAATAGSHVSDSLPRISSLTLRCVLCRRHMIHGEQRAACHKEGASAGSTQTLLPAVQEQGTKRLTCASVAAPGCRGSWGAVHCERRVACHEEVTPWTGDQAGHQAQQVVVHVACAHHVARSQADVAGSLRWQHGADMLLQVLGGPGASCSKAERCCHSLLQSMPGYRRVA